MIEKILHHCGFWDSRPNPLPCVAVARSRGAPPTSSTAAISHARGADSGQTHEPDPDFLEYARREAAESVRQLDIPFDF